MSNEEVAYDFTPMIKEYKGGRVVRLQGTAAIPSSTVQSKDIVISQQPSVSARLYLPKSTETKHPLPAAYNDSWAAIKWVASHFDGTQNGDEEEDDDSLSGYADSQSMFFAGDSARANIAHRMGLRVGFEGLVGVKLIGVVLVDPYFWGEEPNGRETTAPAAKESLLLHCGVLPAHRLLDPMTRFSTLKRIQNLGNWGVGKCWFLLLG